MMVSEFGSVFQKAMGVSGREDDPYHVRRIKSEKVYPILDLLIEIVP